MGTAAVRRGSSQLETPSHPRQPPGAVGTMPSRVSGAAAAPAELQHRQQLSPGRRGQADGRGTAPVCCLQGWPGRSASGAAFSNAPACKAQIPTANCPQGRVTPGAADHLSPRRGASAADPAEPPRSPADGLAARMAVNSRPLPNACVVLRPAPPPCDSQPCRGVRVPSSVSRRQPPRRPTARRREGPARGAG